jgi:hypothetical protein
MEIIKDGIDNLEKAHEALRTWTLTQWNSGSLPGPHIQSLLELLLAARKAIGGHDSGSQLSIDQLTEEQKTKLQQLPPYELLVNNYVKNRDGPSKCSMILLTYEKVLNTTKKQMLKPNNQVAYNCQLLEMHIVVT